MSIKFKTIIKEEIVLWVIADNTMSFVFDPSKAAVLSSQESTLAMKIAGLIDGILAKVLFDHLSIGNLQMSTQNGELHLKIVSEHGKLQTNALISIIIITNPQVSIKILNDMLVASMDLYKYQKDSESSEKLFALEQKLY